MEKLKKRQIGPKFLITYKRVQQELLLMERRIALELYEELLERDATTADFKVLLYKPWFLTKVRRATMKEFQESPYFLGRKDSTALALYNNGFPAPNCYRCRTIHGFNEPVVFPEAMINNHLGRFSWNRKWSKAYSCAECQVDLQIAVWRALNSDKKIWSNGCNPARWSEYNKWKSSGIDEASDLVHMDNKIHRKKHEDFIAAKKAGIKSDTAPVDSATVGKSSAEQASATESLHEPKEYRFGPDVVLADVLGPMDEAARLRRQEHSKSSTDMSEYAGFSTAVDIPHHQRHSPSGTLTPPDHYYD